MENYRSWQVQTSEENFCLSHFHKNQNRMKRKLTQKHKNYARICQQLTYHT